MWIFSAIANAVGRNFIGRPNYLFDLLFNRAQADGGVTEAQQCTINELTDLQNDNLLSSASLVLTPSSYKEGKLYSVIPSDGSGDMSVTRATTATRVNSAGLVELVPYNLFQYSEQFNNAYWEKGGVTITANATTAPDGTLTADKFQEIATTDTHQIYLAYTGNISVVTISIYAKKAERSAIQITSDQTTDPRAIFNLDTGAIHSSLNCTPFIENVGNGWYRCGITYTIDQVTSYPVFRVVDSNFDVLYTGTAGYGVYIWGGQLNEGTILPYQKTETRLNIPRLDYSNGTCPSLLVEPQRTNLIFPSNGSASNSFGGVFTSNAATSPQGINNAFSFDVNNGAAGGVILTTINSTQQLTFSIYLKGSVNGQKVRFYTDNNQIIQTYTLTTEWVRYTSTFTSISGLQSVYLLVGTYFVPAENDLFYGYGAQLEAGSYATSYIPTTSASVTRNADVISKTGISSLIGQTEGTIFFDGVINGCQNDFANLINSERNTNTAFSIGYIKASKNLFGQVFDGSSKGLIQGGTFEIGQRFKLAYAYKSGNFALYVNGALIGTSTNPFTFPSTLDDIFIGDSANYFAFQEAITNNATALWKTRLTNDQLAQLTTI